MTAPLPPGVAARSAADRQPRHLDLEFRPDPRGRTYLHRQYVRYPFHLTRPFHLDRPTLPGLATLYLQSASGGLYAGDRLDSAMRVEPGAAAHVTSQSSTIVHRAHRGQGAALNAEFLVEGDGFLAFTPDPTILFADAELDSRIAAVVAPGASLVLGDAVLGHDPAQMRGAQAGPPGPVRRYLSVVEIQVPGLGRMADRQGFAGQPVPQALDPGGRHMAQAALYCVGPAYREQAPAALLAGRQPPPGTLWGADRLPSGLGLWARVLAPAGHGLTQAMASLFAAAFRLRFGVEPAVRPK